MSEKVDPIEGLQFGEMLVVESPEAKDLRLDEEDFISFDAGLSPVTVYIAYDPAGSAPTSSTHVFTTPVPAITDLRVSDGSVGTMTVVSAAGVTGTVTLGGNNSGGVAAHQGYIVIVVP